MITLGIAKFDFLTGDEAFARRLNGRWDTFFATAFEQVADEVLSAYDIPTRVITIDSLQLELSALPEDDFDRHFASRLRSALQEYMRKWTEADRGVALQAGIRLETAGDSALNVLCFFLLHGYLPSYTDAPFTDLHFLLAQVVGESAYRFREFLESRGHYDFLCRRLVFSFTDDELDEIVRVVQPSESKFVPLYVRVQLRLYPSLKRPDIGTDDYRNAVWALVLAYLFAQSRTRFSRKQLMTHTLRGIAAHFNLRFAGMAQLLTEGVKQLEPSVAQLPELWSLLKEIRQDAQRELYALDGDYRRHLWLELLSALQTDGKGDAAFALSYEHVRYVLSDPSSCRELLRRLAEPQIHRLVGIVAPAEKDYIVSYACFLDKNKESGTFVGKAGSDFRVLKWEFIFSCLYIDKGVGFNHKLFVYSVLRRLAAHYNEEVGRLISYFLQALSEVWAGLPFAGLRAVLQELHGEMGLLGRANNDSPLQAMPQHRRGALSNSEAFPQCRRGALSNSEAFPQHRRDAPSNSEASFALPLPSCDGHDVAIALRNAGLVLLAPYFPLLFHRLGYLAESRKEFKDEDSQVRSVFLLQYAVWGEQREWAEPELFLNKLLTGMEPRDKPLPRRATLSEEETATTEQLLNSVCQHWDKMRSTSPSAFRSSFLQRDGCIRQDGSGDGWEVRVEERAYDVLLDSLPWAFKMCRLPWMDKLIEVKWR